MISATVKTLVKLVLRRGMRVSYGQFGEDAFLQSLLKSRAGTYVDVGAYHPILYSNTYAFYKKGWKGLVVEPNKTLAPLYRIFRRRDIFVTAGVGSPGEMPYYKFSDGAYNTFNPEEAERCKEKGLSPYIGIETITMRPLCDILKNHGIKKIDLLNIDAQGHDLQVLQSHDWSIPTRVIAVEDELFDPVYPSKSPVFMFLQMKGYQLKGYCGLTLLFCQSS